MAEQFPSQIFAAPVRCASVYSERVIYLKKGKRERKKRRIGRRIDTRTKPYVEHNVTKSDAWLAGQLISNETSRSENRTFILQERQSATQERCKGQKKTFVILSFVAAVFFSRNMCTTWKSTVSSVLITPLSVSSSPKVQIERVTPSYFWGRCYLAVIAVYRRKRDKWATESDVHVSYLITRPS